MPSATKPQTLESSPSGISVRSVLSKSAHPPTALVAQLDATPVPIGLLGLGALLHFLFLSLSLKEEEELVLRCEFCGSVLRSLLSDMDFCFDDTHTDHQKRVS